MTLTKTMKTKLVLGILAAAASLSLAIGGTLMLFTDQSETATNTVTLGNAEIQLEEYAPDLPGTDEEGTAVVGDEYTIDGEDVTFEGINFGDTIVPGATLDKRPKVTNTGSIPVYVYVDGTITVVSGQDADGNDVVVDITPKSNEAVAAQVNAILATVGAGELGKGWIGTETSTTANGVTGTYYYTDANGLKALGAGESTTDIFSEVEIPFEDVDNTLAGYTISLALTAYAVQSENNEATTIEDIKAQFNGE